VVLTFRRAPTDGGEGEGVEQPSAVAANGPRDVTVMTVQVGARDTVDTLNRRIRVSVFLFDSILWCSLLTPKIAAVLIVIILRRDRRLPDVPLDSLTVLTASRVLLSLFSERGDSVA
jgi:hypothetical protein